MDFLDNLRSKQARIFILAGSPYSKNEQIASELETSIQSHKIHRVNNDIDNEMSEKMKTLRHFNDNDTK